MSKHIVRKLYLNKLRNIFSNITSFECYEWENAEDFFTINLWKPDQIVFHQDDFPDNVYFIVEGRARYFYVTIDGKEKTKSIVRSGGALASMSTLINNEPSPFYTQALTNGVTASIKYLHLIDLADSYPNWNVLVRKMLERLALKKERREASFLLMTARQRYEQFLIEFGKESEEIPLKHVAMYLGITDVALSRIRKEMNLT